MTGNELPSGDRGPALNSTRCAERSVASKSRALLWAISLLLLYSLSYAPVQIWLDWRQKRFPQMGDNSGGAYISGHVFRRELEWYEKFYHPLNKLRKWEPLKPMMEAY